jgi:hypothetical protein
MAKSKDENVQRFLDDMKEIDEVKYDILQACRKIVFTLFPNVNERIIYGGIMFKTNEDFGGIFASKKHVSFEFGERYLMNDPEGILEGKGKYRRHLKLKTLDDVSAKQVKFFVGQIS